VSKTIGAARHRALIEKLIEAREAAGFTQTELARKLGEYQSFVARMESGQRRIDVVEFLRLSETLDFDSLSVLKQLLRIKE